MDTVHWYPSVVLFPYRKGNKHYETFHNIGMFFTHWPLTKQISNSLERKWNTHKSWMQVFLVQLALVKRTLKSSVFWIARYKRHFSVQASTNKTWSVKVDTFLRTFSNQENTGSNCILTNYSSPFIISH